MILKNKTVIITANAFGKLCLTVYKKDKKGVLEFDNYYKFNGQIEGVDVEIEVPKGCRTEYAKIIKVK